MAFDYKRIYTFPRCGLASVLDNLKYQSGIADVEYLRVTKLFDDSQLESFKPDLILIRDSLDIFCSIWSAGPKSLPRKPLSDFLCKQIDESTIPSFVDVDVRRPFEISGSTYINRSNSFNFDRYYEYGLISDVAYGACIDFRTKFNHSVFQTLQKS